MNFAKFTRQELVREAAVREREIRDISLSIAKLDKTSVGDITAVNILKDVLVTYSRQLRQMQEKLQAMEGQV